MRFKTVHIEKIKTGAIALLAVSALFLMSRAGLLEQFTAAPGESTSTHRPSQTGSATLVMTQPLFIAVSNGEAGRCGIKYEGEKLRIAYGELSMALGEALGSSGEPEPITSDQWERALSGSSVFFDYYYMRDLSLIAEGLGVQTGWDSSGSKASLLCLAEEAGGLALYWLDAETAQAYRSATALDFSRIAFIFDQYPPNGAAFAFELPETYAHLSAYTLILNAMPEVRPVTAKNTLYADDAVERLLKLLNINPFVASRYAEADGTEVYVEGGDKTLRLDGDGWAVFRQSSDSGLQLLTGASSTEQALAGAAWELVSDALYPGGGQARLELSNLSYDPVLDAYTIGFDYVLGGIPIRSASGRGAAQLTVEQGFLTALELWFRDFEPADGSQTVLPERQAAALAEQRDGQRLLLIYEERADAVTAKWVTAR